jgi:peptidyl-prolyl cis-trans isomerase SurA
MRRQLVFSLLLIGAIASVSPNAEARIVDRVVAVVADTPIFLSDLRARATSHLLRLDTAAPENYDEGMKRTASETEMFREVLDRLIDEELVGQAAGAARITVTGSEIDEALDRVAKQSKLTRAELLAEAKKQGVEPAAYRAELFRQILEGKWLSLASTKPPPGSDEAATVRHRESERKRLLAELRAKVFIEVRL